MKKYIFPMLFAAVLLVNFVVPTESGAVFSFFAKHKTVKPKNGEIVIPLRDVDDGKAHYYSYRNDGIKIKFFVVKSRDNVVRAAFDACDVCFPAKKGYVQEGDYMICKNCGRKFHTSRVNVVEGGCNPAPLKRDTVANNLVIKVADIIPGSRFF